MSKTNKEELKKKILNKEIFNAMVDKTFNDADLNKNNYIEKDELNTLLKSIYELAILLKSIYGTLGLNPPEEKEIDDELKRLDKNDDRKLSKEEFRALVRDLCLYFIDQSS